MEIAINDELAARPDYRGVVADANEVLKAIVGRAPHPPRATWRLSRADDASGPIELELTYFDQTLATPFAIAELTDLWELRYRFCEIWGALIRQNNRENTRHMVEVLRDLREGLRTLEGA